MYYFQDLQPTLHQQDKHTRKPVEKPRHIVDVRFLALDILNQMSQGKNWDEMKVKIRTGGEKVFTLYLLFLVHEYNKQV